jgi:hypothetical protein
MSQIGISYTPSGGTPVYNFIFSEFLNQELPRTYIDSATFDFSAGGAAIISGSANAQKRIWAIGSPLPKAEAESFDAMFRAWDNDRAAGLAAAVGITDTTFGATVDTSAVFSTAPTYSRFGPYYMLVSFGLTEV